MNRPTRVTMRYQLSVLLFLVGLLGAILSSAVPSRTALADGDPPTPTATPTPDDKGGGGDPNPK